MEELVNELESGEKTPEIERALKIGKQVFNEIFDSINLNNEDNSDLK